MLGDNSECDPPESISNSEVKPLSANDSVGFPHVKVGHRQAPYLLIRLYPSPFLEGEGILFAGVAQLVEQLICNQQVAGSNPVTSSIF
jgi:hypothetical protein